MSFKFSKKKCNFHRKKRFDWFGACILFDRSSAAPGPIVQLEHLIALNSSFTSVVKYHPLLQGKILYAAGASLVVQSTCDPHDQTFYRAHDADICCLEISRKYITTGQVTSPYRKDGSSPIVVWELGPEGVTNNLLLKRVFVF